MRIMKAILIGIALFVGAGIALLMLAVLAPIAILGCFILAAWFVMKILSEEKDQ